MPQDVVTPEQIGWSSYASWEGAFFRGRHKYTLPDSPDFWDKVLLVITTTEGGSYDAVNMYDRCVLSVGLIQWCDAGYMLSTKMLGHVAETCGVQAVTGPLSEALKSSNATFRKFPEGWRFQFLDERGVVNSSNLQRELYLKGTGLKNSWTSSQKAHAKLWAAGMANIWNDPAARAAQLSYTKPKLTIFATPEVKKDLFDSTEGNRAEAARAIYTSFAANIPLVASKMYKEHTASTKAEKFSDRWIAEMAAKLTWGPGIAIYPKRYDSIRPVVERLWGVTLPHNAQALKNLPEVPPVTSTDPPGPHPPVNTSDETDPKPIAADPPEIVHPDVVVPTPAAKEDSLAEIVTKQPGYFIALLGVLGGIGRFVWAIVSWFLRRPG